jgi:hypothetical protein
MESQSMPLQDQVLLSERIIEASSPQLDPGDALKPDELDDTESALVREYRAHRVEKERRAALWASVFPEPHQTADSDEEGDGDGDAAARLFVTRARDDGWGEARHPLPERMDVLPSLPPALPIAPPPRPAPGKATIESGRPANNLRDPSFEDDSDIPF